MKIIRLEANGQEIAIRHFAKRRDFVSFGRKPSRLHYIRKAIGPAVCQICQQMKKCYQYGIRHSSGQQVWDPGNYCCKQHYLMSLNHELVQNSQIPATV